MRGYEALERFLHLTVFAFAQFVGIRGVPAELDARPLQIAGAADLQRARVRIRASEDQAAPPLSRQLEDVVRGELIGRILLAPKHRDREKIEHGVARLVQIDIEKRAHEGVFRERLQQVSWTRTRSRA